MIRCKRLDKRLFHNIDVDSILVDCMTKTVSVQVTFDPFEEELMLPQSFRNEMKVLFVLFYRV